MAYAFNHVASAGGGRPQDEGVELLKSLTEEDLDALATGIESVDGLMTFAKSANDFRDLLGRLDADQTYALGRALGIGVESPSTRNSLSINRVLIDTRMSREFLRAVLPFAVEAGRSSTELIYSAPFKSHALRAILPPNAFRAYELYGRYETVRDLRRIYGDD